MHTESQYKGKGGGYVCVYIYTRVFAYIISTYDYHMQNTKKKILLYFQTTAHQRCFNRALILSHFTE